MSFHVSCGEGARCYSVGFWAPILLLLCQEVCVFYSLSLKNLKNRQSYGSQIPGIPSADTWAPMLEGLKDSWVIYHVVVAPRTWMPEGLWWARSCSRGQDLERGFESQ